MPGPTDATPAPSFGAPSRIALEADAGARRTRSTTSSRRSRRTRHAAGKLALFHYSYPVAACAFITGAPLELFPQCTPSRPLQLLHERRHVLGAPQTLASMQSLAILPRSGTGNGNPDVGNVPPRLIRPGQR